MLTVLQVRALPSNRDDGAGADGSRLSGSFWSQWRGIAANRAFLMFAVAMTGSYVLSFQVYLALPLEARRIAGDGMASTVGVAALFAVSGAVTIVGQLRVTAWCRARWGPARSMAVGLAVMAGAFAPPIAVARQEWAGASLVAVGAGLGLLVPSAAALALATAIVFPFEMDTIVAVAQGRFVATHYGLYNTVCGVGIMLGNFATGAALDRGRSAGVPELPWLALLAIGMACAGGVRRLDTLGLLPSVADTPARLAGRHRLRPGGLPVADLVISVVGDRHRRRSVATPPMSGRLSSSHFRPRDCQEVGATKVR